MNRSLFSLNSKRLGALRGVLLGALVSCLSAPVARAQVPSGKFPASELLAYFGASCPSQGEWTRAAMGQAQALISALQSLQDDPNCKTISGAIGELQLLDQKIQQLQRVSQEQQELNQLKSREQELLLQLSNTADSSMRSRLLTLLSDVQLATVSAQSALETRNEYALPQQSDLLLQVVNSTNAVTLQAINNQRCLMKRPNTLPAIASLAGSVGVAVSKVNPALGLGIAAGTELLGQTIEYFRKAPIARSIRRISESMAGRAYQCVLESLSNQWCRADDAEQVVRLKAQSRSHTIPAGKEWVQAIRLLDREIPALMNWLEMLRSGAKPASVSDASRQHEVFDREARVRAALPLALGVLEQARPLFEASVDARDRWRVMRRAINDIFGSITAPSPFARNPLGDIYQEPFARYFLLGLEDSEIPRALGAVISFDQFDPFSQWPRVGQVFVPSLSAVEAQVRIWVELARQRVSREMALVLQPDALRTLSEAFDPTQNPWKVSARESLRTVREFLQARFPKVFVSLPYRRIYADTIDRLIQVERELDQTVGLPLPEISQSALDTLGGPGDLESERLNLGNDWARVLPPEQQVLADIYATSGLQFGTIFLRSRLDMAMRVALHEVFQNLPAPVQNVAAQVLASDRYLEVLQRMSGTDNLALILADIQNSKPITQETIQNFSDLFGKNIRYTLRRYQKLELELGGSSGANYRRARAEICLALLASPRWPEKVPLELCDGAQLDPILEGGPSSIRFSVDWLLKPHEERACVYRDYFRLSKIYQDWRTSGRDD